MCMSWTIVKKSLIAAAISATISCYERSIYLLCFEINSFRITQDASILMS